MQFKSILFYFLLSGAQVAATHSLAQVAQTALPNGWKLSPAGTSLPLGDLPLNMVVAPNKKIAAVTNNGQSVQSIQLVDISNEVVTDTKEIGKAWLGLVFSADSKTLYASGGNDNWVIRFGIKNSKLTIKDTI